MHARRAGMLAALWCGLFIGAGRAEGAVGFSIVDLGTLPGDTWSEAQGANDAGQVVGWSGTDYYTVHEAFLWEMVGTNGVMTPLGTLGGAYSEALGINALGEVVGWGHTVDGPKHPFLWLPAPRYGLPAGMNDLGVPPEFSTYDNAEAHDINDSGQVVGYVSDRAFLWQNGVWTLLRQPSPYTRDWAYGINNAGQVVGRWFFFWNLQLWAVGSFYWSTDTGWVNITPPCEALCLTQGAFDINEYGQTIMLGGPFVYLWDNGFTTVINTPYVAYPYGINNALEGVGGVDTGVGVLWDEGVGYDLLSLIPPGTGRDIVGGAATGRDINNLGQIVGAAWRDAPTFEYHAFLMTPDPQDCNSNGIADYLDIAGGTSQDCDHNRVPDECQLTGADCNSNGVPDLCEPDCNHNDVADACDITGGTSFDCTADGIPDECQMLANDCNTNGLPDTCDLVAGTSTDCNANTTLDECELAAGTSSDCNTNGLPDECDLAGGSDGDCNTNGIPDSCDVAAGTAQDCQSNGIPDSCEWDADGNGTPDDCDPCVSGEFFPPAGIDEFPTVAAFKIILLDGTTIEATGLSDPLTVIGRSDPFFHGDPDEAGAPIANGGVPPYADTSPVAPELCGMPEGFPEDPAFGHEIHTEMLSLDLSDGAVSVRAGQPFFDSVMADGRPELYYDSFGEVQALCNDFPADSFFEVFVEVDLGFTKLYNKTPLHLRAEITAFPPDFSLPQSVYIHDPDFPAVPLFDADGIHIGYLRSAGHGDTTLPPATCEALRAIVDSVTFAVDGLSIGLPPGFDPNDVRNDSGTPEQQVTAYVSSGAVPADPPDTTNVRVAELTGTIGPPTPPAFAAGDAIRSLSFGRDGTVDPLTFLPAPGVLYFSVDRASAGDLCSDVVRESGRGEAAADIYTATIMPFGRYTGLQASGCGAGTGNCLILDQSSLGLSPGAGQPNPDDVTALEVAPLNPGDLAYLTLTGPSFLFDGSTIYVYDPQSGPFEYDALVPFAGAVELGLDPDDVIDALILSDDDPVMPGAPNGVFDLAWDSVLFSLAPGSPSLNSNGYSPADVLASYFNGTSWVHAQADALGLLPTDNVDALDIGPKLLFPDCNQNGVDDACDVDHGFSPDCNFDLVPDECQSDCNHNGRPDGCDIAGGFSFDCDTNGVPDECDPDCNHNGIPDDCDINAGTAQDCNTNGVPDTCDIRRATSADCTTNGIPDECEPDCNTNGLADSCDIGAGTAQDCNTNGVPDACDLATGASADCNSDGLPDDCEPDCNLNGVADACEITGGTAQDCNANTVPDDCDIAVGTSADCTSNGIPDECEPDCNTNGAADSCDITAGTAQDCNTNSVPDACDVAGGTSADVNQNGVPDECESVCAYPYSGFDADQEGWTEVNPAQIDIWQDPTGGYPGGYLHGWDRGSSAAVARASNSFSGDWSGLDGRGLIALHGGVVDRDGRNIVSGFDIRLLDVSGYAKWTAPLATTSWRLYRAPLRETDWSLVNTTWPSLLGNITEMWVNMDNTQGSDHNGLDNVRLVRQGDVDDDCDVDLTDHDAFAGCLTGPDTAPAPPGPLTVDDCLIFFDFDLDDDVDLSDFAQFTTVFTGG